MNYTKAYKCAEEMHDFLCTELRNKLIEWIDCDYIPEAVLGPEKLSDNAEIKELAEVTQSVGIVMGKLDNMIYSIRMEKAIEIFINEGAGNRKDFIGLSSNDKNKYLEQVGEV